MEWDDPKLRLSDLHEGFFPGLNGHQKKNVARGRHPNGFMLHDDPEARCDGCAWLKYDTCKHREVPYQRDPCDAIWRACNQREDK